LNFKLFTLLPNTVLHCLEVFELLTSFSKRKDDAIELKGT